MQKLLFDDNRNICAARAARIEVYFVERRRELLTFKVLTTNRARSSNSFVLYFITWKAFLISWNRENTSSNLNPPLSCVINFLPFRTHAILYFAQSNILPITMLYFKLSSTLMLDITTNSAPQNICNLFTSTQDIHQYTRSASSGNYYINHSKLNHHKNSFSIVGAKIWNSIPES